MLAKMKSLIAQLREADIAYYGMDDPIMTDLEYDRLYDELAQLEQKTGIILASSPTQHVSGAVLESLTTVLHTKPCSRLTRRSQPMKSSSLLADEELSSVGSWMV